MLASSWWGAIERRCNCKGIKRRPSATMDSLYPRSSDAATTTSHPAARSAFASDRRCDQKYHSELTTIKIRRFIGASKLPNRVLGPANRHQRNWRNRDAVDGVWVAKMVSSHPARRAVDN